MTLTFISYSRLDSDFTSRLCSDLLNKDIPLWRDIKDIPLGKNWDTNIEVALRGGKVTHFVFIASQNSVQSENVLNEISIAVDEGIEYIIPVVIDDCQLPLLVCRRNFVDFRQDYDVGFARLAEFYATKTVDAVKHNFPKSKIIRVRPATQQQLDAAHDDKPQVRLIAGPGTGKSFVIEERVFWLLTSNVPSDTIHVVSFTRAASRDLHNRILRYCEARGQQNIADSVSVTTLHSLALTALRKARLLAYPVEPTVIDEWEIENVFDAEFREETKYLKGRCEDIRLAFEAFWCTGQWNPPNYIPPEKEISELEKQAFIAFHGVTTQTYACVLPGEIVQKCVENTNAGLLDPVTLLKIGHLIVDEFQDLNEMDLAFVHNAINHNATTFVAGDDDQSVYSFRFAFPLGIQTFTTTYQNAGRHELTKCFRCTPNPLTASRTLISAFPGQHRIPKSLISQYETTQPSIEGLTFHWIFKSGVAEANAIAHSCRILIENGIKPRDILILISNRPTFVSKNGDGVLQRAFKQANVQFELPSDVSYVDMEPGRFALALIRIACDPNLKDYMAHRLILGLPKGIGIKTCNKIRNIVIDNNLNYLNIFYLPLPQNTFSGRELSAIKRARGVCEQIRDWQQKDTLIQRKDTIGQLIADAFDSSEADNWKNHVNHLPDEMNLKEIRAYLETDNDEQQASTLEAVYNRLELQVPEQGFLPPKVRVMTMHGAKGLEAQVVFVPALEDHILPGEKRKLSTGLVYEAARLLYVSITRTKAACIMSYAKSRSIQGSPQFGLAPSPFNKALNGIFKDRETGFTLQEGQQIVDTVKLIEQLNSPPTGTNGQ